MALEFFQTYLAMQRYNNVIYTVLQWLRQLRGCLYGGGPTLLVGLALVFEGWISPRVYMGKASRPTQAGLA